MISPSRSRRLAPAFTLPAVMVVAAAMLILAVGLLAIMGIEKKTARSFTDSKRAELAARAGLEDFRAVLRTETANDDYLVIGGTPPNLPTEDRESNKHLFIARGSGGGENVEYRFLPLFSTSELPDKNTKLEAPKIDDGEGKQFTTIKGPPWLEPARVEWIPVRDEKNNMVARYAYWVEDLQSKVDATTAGNNESTAGTHDRSAWPFPAAGLNPNPPDDDEPKLNGVAIHVLDPAKTTTEDGDGRLFSKISDGRKAMLSPESVVAATGYDAPLKRADNGLLEDPLAAALEKSASAVNRPYKEHPVVPYALGISADAAGKPKRNLNKMLGSPRPSAIDDFASWIDTALPDFKNRKGGFPDDYLRTLAANAFDYADTDSDSSFKSGSYRGVDSFPLVSEFAMSFRWDGLARENGRLYLVLEIGTYVELWNMTDQPVQGQGQVTFESKFIMPAGANPGSELEEVAAEEGMTQPVLKKEEGYLWYPPFSVSLQPNEYRLIPSKVRLKVDVGTASGVFGGPADLGNSQQDNASGYRFRWNGVMVDQSRKHMWKQGGLLYDPSKGSPIFSRASVPAHSHSLGALNGGPFQNNMGDPRMAMYLNTPQASNAYPDNYSPNRRNIRWTSIYSGDSTKRRYYGRVLPAEWPDGGHNSAFGSSSFVTTDKQIKPDDPKFFTGIPAAKQDQAPMRLSNLGRFYSATELGRVYDPIMWKPAYVDLSGKPGSGARDTDTLNAGTTPSLPTERASFPDLAINSSSNASYGGGNTLRVGRFEHQLFERPGMHAAHMLDIFHAGEGTSDKAAEREGDLINMQGNVNLNTADTDTLRTLVAGTLRQDPALCQATSTSHQTTTLMAPPTNPLKLGTPTRTKIADRVAEALIRKRPFASAADIASARDNEDKPVFGNREMYTQNLRLEWTDSAAEEVFHRLYDASTLRSRNFRVWVIGQAVVPLAQNSNAEPVILSECKKSFTVFADPGVRKNDGTIDTTTYRPRVTHENDF